jgi:hypothetical protein
VIVPLVVRLPLSVLSIWIAAEFSPSTVIEPVFEIEPVIVPPDAL